MLPADAAFCDGCGAQQEAPAAGRPAEPADADPRAYTPKHLADRILSHRGTLEGERKLVTVLFADCKGFTGLSEARSSSTTRPACPSCRCGRRRGGSSRSTT